MNWMQNWSQQVCDSKMFSVSLGVRVLATCQRQWSWSPEARTKVLCNFYSSHAFIQLPKRTSINWVMLEDSSPRGQEVKVAIFWPREKPFSPAKYPLKQGGLPAAFKAGGVGLAKVSLNQRFWCALFSSRLGQGQGDLVLTTVAFFNPTFPIAHHFKKTVPERSKPHCEPSCQVQNNIPKEVSLKPVTILSLPLSRKYCLISPKFPK